MTDDVLGGARTDVRPVSRFATVWSVVLVALASLTLVSCGGGKQIRHYQPRVANDMLDEAALGNDDSDVVLAVEDFATSPAYDEQRIVYRESPYRFDYYHYHRWSSPPGLLVADLIRQIYQATGAYEAVVGYSSTADVVLNGRVVAFEEVDHTETWSARVILDLQLRDAMTGRMLWNERVEQVTTLKDRTPSGLAAAMSRAMTKIGVRTTPAILQAARTRKSKSAPGKPPSSMPGDADEKETPDQPE
jgi:ABC-type uncharacterized transport system auxiliary subunit